MNPTPDLFLDALLGYQKTAAMKAALALDLFTAIAGESGDVTRLAARTGASQRGVRILCDYLAVQGLLTKEGARYGLTPSTETFLTSTSPAWMGSVADFLAAPEMTSLWLADPVACVRNGGSVGLANIAPDNPVWVTFAKAMVPFMQPVAQAVAAEVGRWPQKPKRVLDIAAGHGLFGITLALALPDAQITAVDWQGVLQVARQNAEAAGIAGRYRTVPGNAFEVDWGSGNDLVLLTNFLHHFDRDSCIGLLRKARASLAEGGCVLAVEMVPNPDRVSPPFPAMFAYIMLGSTPQGDAYTAAELDGMGRAAGFSRIDVTPAPPSAESIIVYADR